MRVVSLVPSWTETLIEAGVEVVGRTRFCIHPSDGVAGIPRVGGTKDWDFARIVSLKPDLLVLDREENPRFMGEQVEVPYVATDVCGVEDMPEALRQLAAAVGSNERLVGMARDWEQVLARSKWRSIGDPGFWDRLPGVLEWGRKPTAEIADVVYVIWKDPWMAVGPNTFIASVLERFGLSVFAFSEKYPKIDFASFDRAKTLLLFSSEPYPFMKKRDGLDALGFPYAFVDGECFSWFGVRTLRFLEQELR